METIDLAFIAGCAVLCAVGSYFVWRRSARMTLLGFVVGGLLVSGISAASNAAEKNAAAWDAAIASLEDTYDVSITRYPNDTSVPGEWKVDGQFLDCYAEGLPDDDATDAERDADPLLMCAATNDAFVPYDDLPLRDGFSEME